MVLYSYRTSTGEDRTMPESIFEFDASGILNPDEACRVTFPGAGNIRTLCAIGDIGPALLDQLNEAKKAPMADLWKLQTGAELPASVADLIAQGLPDGPALATARYSYAPLEDFKPGQYCACVEVPGSVVWLVPDLADAPAGHEAHMSPRFMEQINLWLVEIVEKGLLRRDRPDE
jgi:hypothetical protein